MKLLLVILISVFYKTKGQENKLPSLLECGRVPISTRIIGGRPAKYGSYPWLVAVGKSEGDFFDMVCTGNLITNRYVLTVAHCFRGSGNSHVRVGEYDLESSYDGAKPVTYAIIDRKTWLYDRENKKNDIGLALLDREVEFNAYVRPACLPYPEWKPKTFFNEKLTAYGWGHRDLELSRSSAVPFKVDLAAVRISRCNSIGTVYSNSTFICAGTEKRNICKGDSGGSLMYLDPETGSEILVGLPVYTACGEDDRPSVFMRVSAYMFWIRETVEQL